MNISLDNLEKLANVIQISVSELLRVPRFEDLHDDFRALGIEQPRAHYGLVAVVHEGQITRCLENNCKI